MCDPEIGPGAYRVNESVVPSPQSITPVYVGSGPSATEYPSSVRVATVPVNVCASVAENPDAATSIGASATVAVTVALDDAPPSVSVTVMTTAYFPSSGYRCEAAGIAPGLDIGIDVDFPSPQFTVTVYWSSGPCPESEKLPRLTVAVAFSTAENPDAVIVIGASSTVTAAELVDVSLGFPTRVTVTVAAYTPGSA